MFFAQARVIKPVQQAAGRCLLLLICLILLLAACQEGQSPTPQASPRALVPTFTPTTSDPALTPVNTPVADQVEVPAASTVASLPVASSTPSAQFIQPLSTDTLLFARMNGDLVLYDLNLGQEQLLMPGRYGPGNREFQWFAAVDTPVRLSPDGRWLLVPTADQGTWLVAVGDILSPIYRGASGDPSDAIRRAHFTPWRCPRQSTLQNNLCSGHVSWSDIAARLTMMNTNTEGLSGTLRVRAATFRAILACASGV